MSQACSSLDVRLTRKVISKPMVMLFFLSKTVSFVCCSCTLNKSLQEMFPFSCFLGIFYSHFPKKEFHLQKKVYISLPKNEWI